MNEYSVVLVSMPWNRVFSPSIQLGTLQALLDRCGISCASKSYYLGFTEYLDSLPSEHRLSVEEYDEVADGHYGVGLGEWIFAVPPFRELNAKNDEAYADYLRQVHVPERIIQRAFRLRSVASDFLHVCLAELLRAKPQIVGFSTMFSQSAASLALARLLKDSDPTIKIVFGGANCQAEMGAALFRCFPYVDAVVRGEAEHTFPALVQEWLDGRPVSPAPGLCYREGGVERIIEHSRAGAVPMDDVPLPNYDEFFLRLAYHPHYDLMESRVVIPFESARGCWWGAKSHCTFCGLNGATMDFRSKSPDRVYQEIMTLAGKHRWLRLFAVDNILDMRYMRELLPKLRQERTDIRLFYETKANLRKDQLRLMREAGVRDVQPGIETFSNSILKLMRKGTTGLQNIRLLKWCAQLGIDVHWNIIYGLPSEPVEEYTRMAGVLRTLTHLKPPQLVRLCIDRFSPYHGDPESHGLRIVGPLRWYQYVYDIAPEDLMDLAYQFEAQYADGRDPERYVCECRDVVRHWNEAWPGSQGALSYSRGPGFLTITDRRPNFQAGTRRLDELEADIYLACDNGPSVSSIRDTLLNAGWDPSITHERILAIADELTRAGFMYEEEGKYLSLALCENSNEIVGGLEATDYEKEPARERIGLKEQLATCDSSQQLIKILSNYAPRRFEGRGGQSAAHSTATAGGTGVSEDVRVE